MEIEKCLLFVDDEDYLCRMVELKMNALGWKVLTAYDGLAALELYKGNSSEVTVVVSDLMMPGITGEVLLPELRSLNGALPLIAITGHSDRVAHLRALTTGAYFYLEKPLSLDLLERYLENAHRYFELWTEVTQARQQDERAARLFRQFVVSHTPRETVLSRRTAVGGIGIEIAAHSFGGPDPKPSGDYMEWFSRGSEEVFFTLGDVAGHGEVYGTLLACMASIILHRSHHEGRPGPGEIISRIDESLRSLQNDKALGSRKSICLFLGSLSLLSGRLAYVNAGHTVALLLRENGNVSQRLKPQAAAAAFLPDSVQRVAGWSEQIEVLLPGDLLVVYSDGVSDVLGPEDGPSANLAQFEEVLLRFYQPTAAIFLDRLVAHLEECATPAGFKDDATILMIRVLETSESKSV